MDQSYYSQNKLDISSYSYIAEQLVKDILSLASIRLDKKPSEMIVLDVGSGYGLYSKALTKFVKYVVGVEPFLDGYKHAITYKNKKLKFHNVLIEDFKSVRKFDLVLSLTTLEHMPHAKKSFENIFKLLKKNGIIYLTVPNKLWPFENHYGLPFLSYLPVPLANIYLRLSGLGKSYQDSSYSMTYFQIKKFFDQFPCTYEFILPDPNSLYVGLGNTNPLYTFVKKTGISLIRSYPFLWTFSKGFMMIIKKN